MFGMCTSEALVPSSSAFLHRGLRFRGGADAVACRSSSTPLKGELNDVNGNSDNRKEIQLNGSKGLKIKKQKLNGQSQATTTANNNDNKNNKNKLVDYPIPAAFIAETNLPTDVGQYRLRAYRTEQPSNEFAGNEPVVIYSASNPPFGTDEELREDIPVRIHDQCLTSEVFRSQR
jgi:hypothetical protein